MVHTEKNTVVFISCNKNKFQSVRNEKEKKRKEKKRTEQKRKEKKRKEKKRKEDSNWVSLASLELDILLPQHEKCWDILHHNQFGINF